MDFLGINLFHSPVSRITAMKSGDRTALPLCFADNRSTAYTQSAQNKKQHETVHIKNLP